MIGQNILKIRKSKGLTLSELAERAKVSKSYLSNIERNLKQNPSIQVIEKLAYVLDVELNVLLHEDEKRPNLSEQEWVAFVEELRKSGIRKEQLREYKTILEFIKWQNEICKLTKN
ncbi:helix-turn-helix domain-containing protein [Guptibacillus spartinae]|uniref:helix-turn-helix domain-containing protein n=1 Tax=Guptibacillus spartinae TaxID=3025679 RepID=UPI00235F54F8|nr:helix-turn-helix transcriptional regulator [Pseudalkalibacillus spartinae]